MPAANAAIEAIVRQDPTQPRPAENNDESHEATLLINIAAAIYFEEIKIADIKQKITPTHLLFILNITFLYFSISENEFLLLLGSDKDPQFKKSFWYVVTGGCENEDSSLKETVKREIKEETNLDVLESTYLNWIFKYKSLGNDCIEYVFISRVTDTNIILNEESIEYKWCSLEDFVNLIQWYGDKILLNKVLEKAIDNKIYFKNEKTEIFN